MAAILGMLVYLATDISKEAQTNDEVYIGLWGRGGGREFPLSATDHKDFHQGNDTYVLGANPGLGELVQSDRSKPGEANDPALVPIDLDSIQYVYVRKQAYGMGNADNAWRLATAIVTLYDEIGLPLPGPRMFVLNVPKGMWLGNEHGHQAWLTESRIWRPAVVNTFVGRFEKAFQAYA